MARRIKIYDLQKLRRLYLSGSGFVHLNKISNSPLYKEPVEFIQIHFTIEVFFSSHKMSDQCMQTDQLLLSAFYDSPHFYRCMESGMYQTMASWVGSIVSFEK